MRNRMSEIYLINGRLDIAEEKISDFEDGNRNCLK